MAVEPAVRVFCPAVSLHDTASGQTLFCIPTGGVKLLALSPDQKRLATVKERQDLRVRQPAP